MSRQYERPYATVGQVIALQQTLLGRLSAIDDRLAEFEERIADGEAKSAELERNLESLGGSITDLENLR